MMDDRNFAAFLNTSPHAATFMPQGEPLLRVIPIAAWMLCDVAAWERDRMAAIRDGIRYELRRGGVRGAARELDIPWVARKVPWRACNDNMALAVRELDPSSFAQALPAGTDWKFPAGLWADIVARGARKTLRAGVLRWLAFNAADLYAQAGGAGTVTVIDYLARLEDLHRSTGAARVIEDSRTWHAALGAGPMENISAQLGVAAAPAARALLRVARALAASPEDWRDNPRYAAARAIAYRFAGALPRSAGGYGFRLLSSRAAFEEEHEVMRHCVDDYWPDAVDGTCLIFAVSEAPGRGRATLELDRRGGIVQLQGPQNTAPRASMIAAAQDFSRQVRLVLEQAGAAGELRPAMRIAVDLPALERGDGANIECVRYTGGADGL